MRDLGKGGCGRGGKMEGEVRHAEVGVEGGGVKGEPKEEGI